MQITIANCNKNAATAKRAGVFVLICWEKILYFHQDNAVAYKMREAARKQLVFEVPRKSNFKLHTNSTH